MDLTYRCDRYTDLRDTERGDCNDIFLGQARRIQKVKDDAISKRKIASAEQDMKARARTKQLSDMGCEFIGQFFVTQKLRPNEYEIQKANVRRFDGRLTLVEGVAILQTVKTEFRSDGIAAGLSVKKTGTRKVKATNGFEHTVSTYVESEKCDAALHETLAH
jgi:hypothetical protein